MEDIKTMTDQQIKSEYKMYFDIIHNEHGCYSTRDLRWLDALERELDKRGYFVEYWTTLKIIKK